MVKEERKVVKEVLQQLKNNPFKIDLRKKVCDVVMETCNISYLQELWVKYGIELKMFINYLCVIIAKKLSKRGVSYDIDNI